MDGYDATTYGQRWADVYDDWYDDPAEVAATVGFLAGVAGPPEGAGCLLELGIGTGRLALPLAAMGYDVRGVDASPAMVARLRAKPGADAVPVAVGDMAEVPLAPAGGRAGEADPRAARACTGVFVASNTFFGLATEDAQRRCLTRVHEVLMPNGWFAVAAFVPDERIREGQAGTVGVRSLTTDRVVLTADRFDSRSQTISGQFIDITEQGIRLRPVHIRYLWPEQLDALAAAAGLELTGRWSSWARAPFDDDSTAHVSLYQRP
jgi:SAM-dependent methyltransferase